MNPEQIEGLIRELTGALRQVLQSGETLSDEFQGRIAQTLNGLLERLNESRQAQAQAIPQQIEAPPPNDAKLLWILSGSQPDVFRSYLANFPTQATQALLGDPNRLESTISQLQEELPQQTPPVVDGIPHAPLISSNVWGANYDPRSKKMRVRFQGGSEYEYDGIPENIFRAFISGNASAKTSGSNAYGRWWRGKSPSIGASMHEFIIKGAYPYRRLR